MPLQSIGIVKADLDAMYQGSAWMFPECSREEFPAELLRMIELKSVRVMVTPEEIRIEVTGGHVSCTIPRPSRETE